MSTNSNSATNTSGSQGMEIFTSVRFDPQTEDATNGHFYMLDYHRDRLQESATQFGFTNAVSRFEGSDGLDWLKESLSREVKSYKVQNAIDDDVPLAVRVVFTSTGYMRTDIRPVEKVRREVLFPSSLDIPKVSQDAGPISNRPFKPSPLTGGVLHVSSTSSPSSPATTLNPTWCLLLDRKPTLNGPLCTYKTTQRQHYDDARARSLPESLDNYHQYRYHDVILYDEDDNITETSICSIYFLRDGKWVTPPVADPDRRENLKGGNRGSTRRWALKQGFCEEAVITKDSVKAGELCWVSNGVRGFNVGLIGEGGGLSSSNVSTPLATSPSKGRS